MARRRPGDNDARRRHRAVRVCDTEDGQGRLRAGHDGLHDRVGLAARRTVTLVLHEVATGHADRTYYADADTAGRITNAQFATDVSHLGVRFYVTARGAASQAQVTFTDAKGTDTALVSSVNPSGSGEQVTFTATVTETNSGGGTAGAVVTIGSVTFREGGNNCNQGTVIAGPLSLNSAGQATAAKTFHCPPRKLISR